MNTENNNSLNNLPPFYVGQKVVYVGSSNEHIKNGHSGYVTGLYKQKCNCWAIDIDNVKHTLTKFYEPLDCAFCGASSNEDYCVPHFQFIGQNEVRPLQEQKFPLIKLTKVIEKEKELLCCN